jgi:hypothetical protein
MPPELRARSAALVDEAVREHPGWPSAATLREIAPIVRPALRKIAERQQAAASADEPAAS